MLLAPKAVGKTTILSLISDGSLDKDDVNLTKLFGCGSKAIIAVLANSDGVNDKIISNVQAPIFAPISSACQASDEESKSHHSSALD